MEIEYALLITGMILALPLGGTAFLVIRNIVYYGPRKTLWTASVLIASDTFWVTVGILIPRLKVFIYEHESVITFIASIVLAIIGFFIVKHRYNIQKKPEFISSKKILMLSLSNATIVITSLLILSLLVGEKTGQIATMGYYKIGLVSIGEMMTWSCVMFTVYTFRKTFSQLFVFFGIFILLLAIIAFLKTFFFQSLFMGLFSFEKKH